MPPEWIEVQEAEIKVGVAGYGIGHLTTVAGAAGSGFPHVPPRFDLYGVAQSSIGQRRDPGSSS